MSDASEMFVAVRNLGPSRYVIKVIGDIHHGNAADLQEALLDGLISTPDRLIVDVAAVSTIDAAGLDVLVRAQRRARAGGTELMMWRANAELADLLEHNGLPSAAGSTERR